MQRGPNLKEIPSTWSKRNIGRLTVLVKARLEPV
jgi:hypothetical protein